MSTTRENPLNHWVAKIFFSCTWIPWYLVFLFFFHYRVVYEDTRVRTMRGPFLIVANHSSALDPFLLSGIFPLTAGVFPIHFATYYKFFQMPLTAFFVRCYGCFPVQHVKGLEANLLPALQFLREGEVVGIFPHGKRFYKGRPPKGKRGAAFLALHSGATILPVYIKDAKGLTMKNVFLRKRYIVVHVGTPFSLPEVLHKSTSQGDALDIGTNIVMEKMRDLA